MLVLAVAWTWALHICLEHFLDKKIELKYYLLLYKCFFSLLLIIISNSLYIGDVFVIDREFSKPVVRIAFSVIRNWFSVVRIVFSVMRIAFSVVWIENKIKY